jgi:hypothetical protein
MKMPLLTMILITLLGVQGCATVGPDGEKQANKNTALWVIGGLVVVGAMAASSGGGDSDENCYWVYRENGQSRVCNPYKDSLTKLRKRR